ncbi:branched-chain alpha-keto acid dehydrogenase subunit E2 [Enemella dayhoffiae]|uniref:Dihydrolipoamide acetyltransferase component of pyruvate dehydrogenase complex n=1 Tax=Enemella dayhoffiae TaxID=2016507 RepID=A0A255GVE5_9ACTN|nr:dihydrolipoamide acetyltransferase family protein [Enemella dayhoffiae]OYO18593.1 branched-chain alpha-keto acid dehydrogenase subunit E2 [Enemella dayhoffiae]
MKVFKLTDPGEGLTEAEIVTWRVAEGDTVKVNDIVVEVETSKSLVELPIPWAGTVAKIMVPAGETVDVGTPIIQIDDGSGDEPPAQGGGAADADKEGAQKRTPNLVGYGAVEGSTKRRARKGRPAADESASVAHEQVTGTFDMAQPVSRHADLREPLHGSVEGLPRHGELPGPGQPARLHTLDDDTDADADSGAGRPLAKPPVRRLAKDLGIDLSRVRGTGEDGVITREDVQSAAAGQGSGGAGSGSGTAGASQERRVPIKGVRKMTAEAMVSSAFTAPHATEWVTCDVTAMMELLEKLKQHRDLRGVRLSPLLLVARAALLAIGRNPELNTSWDASSQEIVYHPQVNLGIAAATPRGLLVPNVKGADRLSLAELAEALKDLVAVAKEGRSQPADLSGGTFTITNIGVFGIDGGTPILNPGEAGILAVGAIQRRPWVVGGPSTGSGTEERIEARWVTTLAVSFDHRLVDGEQGSKFLADVARIVTDPGMALLF